MTLPPQTYFFNHLDGTGTKKGEGGRPSSYLRESVGVSPTTAVTPLVADSTTINWDISEASNDFSYCFVFRSKVVFPRPGGEPDGSYLDQTC